MCQSMKSMKIKMMILNVKGDVLIHNFNHLPASHHYNDLDKSSGFCNNQFELHL